MLLWGISPTLSAVDNPRRLWRTDLSSKRVFGLPQSVLYVRAMTSPHLQGFGVTIKGADVSLNPRTTPVAAAGVSLLQGVSKLGAISPPEPPASAAPGDAVLSVSYPDEDQHG
jgi:hypothetical protein